MAMCTYNSLIHHYHIMHCGRYFLNLTNPLFYFIQEEGGGGEGLYKCRHFQYYFYLVVYIMESINCNMCISF